MQMVRRYSRLLRQQQALARGTRIGARERRIVPDTEQSAREVSETSTRRMLTVVGSQESSAAG